MKVNNLRDEPKNILCAIYGHLVRLKWNNHGYSFISFSSIFDLHPTSAPRRGKDSDFFLPCTTNPQLLGAELHFYSLP